MDLTTHDFDRLRTMVFAHSAIVLEPGKEYLVESRLAPIVRKEGLVSFSDLAARINGPDSARICGLIVDAMTTNETSFFRDTHPWDTLREVMLPELIAARSSVKRLTIWCAASSSGQEPYSLAMMLHEHFPEVASTWTIKIIGTDLSPTMVKRSSSGRFSQLEVNRGLPIQLLMKYFGRVGNEWEIREDLRRIVEFREGNLVDPKCASSVPLVDGIFIRNVLIYFDKSTRMAVLEHAHGRLRSDGFLMLGSAETAVGADGRFERFQVGKTIYFKPSNETRTDVGALGLTRAVAALTGTRS